MARPVPRRMRAAGLLALALALAIAACAPTASAQSPAAAEDLSTSADEVAPDELIATTRILGDSSSSIGGASCGCGPAPVVGAASVGSPNITLPENNLTFYDGAAFPNEGVFIVSVRTLPAALRFSLPQ